MKAELKIYAASKNGKTFLKNAYFTTPFKLINITEDKTSSTLDLMLMSSSPGILDGDKYDIEINLEAGSSLNLQTQSYQRLFQMKQGASQSMNIRLADNAMLCYIPHPTVPHEHSIYIGYNKIYLTKTSTLFWGEILTCGRKLSSEKFKFTKYHNKTEIYLENKLVVKENLLIHPHEVQLNSIGQLENYSHQASLICISPQANLPEINEFFVDQLNKHLGICFGVSALPITGFIVRILGDNGDQLFTILKQLNEITNSSFSSTTNDPNYLKSNAYAA